MLGLVKRTNVKNLGVLTSEMKWQEKSSSMAVDKWSFAVMHTMPAV